MSKRPRCPNPTPIQETLARILKPADLRQLELLCRIRQVWEQNLSPTLLAHTELVDFSRKTLYVEVAANPWVQELHFVKPRILAAMEKALGKKVVQDIRFRVK